MSAGIMTKFVFLNFSSNMSKCKDNRTRNKTNSFSIYEKTILLFI